MAYWITFPTATHIATHGPFASIEDAREEIHTDLNFFANRCAAIRDADDESEAVEAERDGADAIEYAHDLRDSAS